MPPHASESNPSELPPELQHLPKDVGWILLISGLLSELGIPGIPPFWIAGIMILWPGAGYRIAKPLRKRFPKAFSQSMDMISRYADDLERRYPSPPLKKTRNPDGTHH